MMMDHPDRLISVTQVAPGSPYGFGGTKDEHGTPCFDDFAGSGGGLVNPQLIEYIQQGNTLAGLRQFTPRSALRALVYKPPFVPEREMDLLAGALAMHMGDEDVPGDKVEHVAQLAVCRAGRDGGHQCALAPKYAGDVSPRCTGSIPNRRCCGCVAAMTWPCQIPLHPTPVRWVPPG
jgi:hypothetical protein